MSNNPEAIAGLLAALEGNNVTGRSQTSPEHEGDPTHEDVSPVQRDELLAMFFEEKTWRGLPNHVCIVCDAGFLESDRAIDHALSDHRDLIDVRKQETIEESEPATAADPDLELDWPDEGIEL